jgi:hypothetical protein
MRLMSSIVLGRPFSYAGSVLLAHSPHGVAPFSSAWFRLLVFVQSRLRQFDKIGDNPRALAIGQLGKAPCGDDAWRLVPWPSETVERQSPCTANAAQFRQKTHLGRRSPASTAWAPAYQVSGGETLSY